ncbi:GRAM domain-containing protein 2B-like isoform X2 [Cololabis saira]|uniref:GRAM domain-containing protein 2B-like isoform X2 n=1 Tax=Cololabis saira TaxID=129043 RepID=UPI002AD344AB|nr:GRAM domain-containing protein 2B-like isoform X2 [Cololabis saira]
MSLKRRFSLESSSLEATGIAKVSNVFNNKRSGRRKSLDGARLEIPQLNQSLDSKMSLRQQTIAEESLERSDGYMENHGYLKRDKTFHKLFPAIPETEYLKHMFTCSMQKELLYHGKLFVSEQHVCFYSSVLLKDTKVMIPVSSVSGIKKQNSTLSMLSIQTSNGEKYSFAHIRNRERCLKLLQSVCSNVQEGSPTSSPHLSSAENEGEHDMVSSHSSMDDSPDFSSIYLDNFPQMSREAPCSCSSTRQSSLTDDDRQAVSWIWRITEKATSLFFFREINTLNVLFYIYVMLLLLVLLTSGYIGLRITALEEQLNSLGALSDFSSHYKE